MKQLSVLFVCSQNRCRSIAAEGIFRYIARETQTPCQLDSAGLDAQAGLSAEKAICEAAALRGYDFSTLRSRALVADDYHCFEYILASDQDTQRGILKRAPSSYPAHIALLMSYAVFFSGKKNIAYPCSAKPEDFFLMLDCIEDACLGFFHVAVQGRQAQRGS